MDTPPSRPSFIERISALLMREPEDREQLLALLHSAYERNLLDSDALSIIEGALQVSDMQVRDIGIVGYALVAPAAFLLLALLFGRAAPAGGGER